MMSQHFISCMLVITHNMLLNCASASVHTHKHFEREEDGSYRPQTIEDHDGESGHNPQFDHEAILGSMKEATEYDKLTPEEAKERLAQLLPKMDLNKDQFIDEAELKKWILNSFVMLSREEAEERLVEADLDRDGLVSWAEYLHDTYGVDSDEEIGEEFLADSGRLLDEEKAMWTVADQNGDGVLNVTELEMFLSPEEHAPMHALLVQQALRERDANGDGLIDFMEFIDHDKKKYAAEEKEWLAEERDRFELEADHNGDGALDDQEIRGWIIPDNDAIANDETEHLIETADDDKDGKLSYQEVLRHHDTFVGSDATDHGSFLERDAFDPFYDEL